MVERLASDQEVEVFSVGCTLFLSSFDCKLSTISGVSLIGYHEEVQWCESYLKFDGFLAVIPGVNTGTNKDRIG